MSSPHELSREPFPFSESFWNPVIAGAMRSSRTLHGGRSGGPVGAPSTIRVSNTMSAVNCPKYGVMKLDAPVTLPSVSAEAFQSNGLTMKGIAPVAGDSFVITQEALPYSPVGFGNAVLRGITVCKINVIAESDKFADCVDDDVDKLKSGGGGPAEILWKESGTGTKWAIVRIGNAQAPAGLEQLRVKEVSATEDWLRCRTWDGSAEGTHDVYVARPYTMRRTPYDGQTIDGKTYSFLLQSGVLTRHIIFSDSSFERQKITPPYLVNDIIYATTTPTEVTVSGTPVGLLDINCDSRAWAENDIYS